MGPQARDAIGIEPVATRRRSSLPIEDARDHRIRVEPGETTHEIQRVLVGSDSRGSRARQRHIDIGQRAALPAYRQMGGRFVAVDRENHFLDERSQELLLIAWRRRRCVQHRGQVGAKGNKALSFCVVENARSLLQSVGKFLVCRLQIKQALLTRVRGGAKKWALIEAAGAMEALAGVPVQRAGLSLAEPKVRAQPAATWPAVFPGPQSPLA